MRSSGLKIDQPLGWDDLRTALFLARAGSVRAAARSLGVSHSTVLRRVANLARSTGARLFERTPEGYALTAAGRDVLDTANDVEHAIVELDRRLHGRDRELAGAVRVTLPDPLLPFFAPLFADLARALPAIEVTLDVGTGFADLARRQADLAVRVVHEPAPELIGRRVATVKVGVYATPEYLKGRSTRDLASLDWVGWEKGSRMAFAQWMTANVPDARVALRVSTGWAIRDAVDASIGVALQPCALGETRAWRRVRIVDELSAPMWLVAHKDLRTNARVRAVRDFLASAVARRRALLEGLARS